MRPCIGIPLSDMGLSIPPLCQWHQLEDGTYTLGDVMRFHLAIDDQVRMIQNAKHAN